MLMPAVQECKMLGYLSDLSKRFDFLTVIHSYRLASIAGLAVSDAVTEK
jgi:hypothetical protein